MDGPTEQPLRRTLTPAVLASALFVAASALIAITFVASRGGLQMPVAPSGSAVAVASRGPSGRAGHSCSDRCRRPSPGPSPRRRPQRASQAPAPEPAPGHAGTDAHGAAGSAGRSCPAARTSPGCYEYLIKRGDCLSGVASRYAIPVSIVLALNPEITDPSTIVVGQILYLGRSPFLRLPPCPTCRTARCTRSARATACRRSPAGSGSRSRRSSTRTRDHRPERDLLRPGHPPPAPGGVAEAITSGRRARRLLSSRRSADAADTPDRDAVDQRLRTGGGASPKLGVDWISARPMMRSKW